MGSKGVVWRPIATIAAAVGDVELEDEVLRLSRYLGYAKVLLNNFYFLGGGPALKKVTQSDWHVLNLVWRMPTAVSTVLLASLHLL